MIHECFKQIIKPDHGCWAFQVPKYGFREGLKDIILTRLLYLDRALEMKCKEGVILIC